MLQLPDALKDHYMKAHGQKPTADVLKFCKRELFQQIWLLLLDNEFMEAYEHGIKLVCGDGVTRRLFPRIFTYSADYPEKYVMRHTSYLSQTHSLSLIGFWPQRCDLKQGAPVPAALSN